MKSQNQALNEHVRSIIYDISKNSHSIKKVGIFGSYARGDYDSNSDIDILYEYTEGSDDLLNDLYSFANCIETQLPKALNNSELQIDFVTIDGLNSGIMKDLNQSIISNILKDVVWIYDKAVLNNKLR